MGVRTDALVAALTGKLPRQWKGPDTIPAPTGVVLYLGSTEVNCQVLADPLHPNRYVVYGPTNLAAFDEVPTIYAEQCDSRVRLQVALLYESTVEKYTFAPVPAVTTRAASVAA